MVLHPMDQGAGVAELVGGHQIGEVGAATQQHPQEVPVEDVIRQLFGERAGKSRLERDGQS